MEFYIELAGLLSERAHLNRIARLFEDLGCVTVEFLLIALLRCLFGALLSHVDVHVEVLAVGSVIIPAFVAVKRLRLVLGANFLIQRVNAFLVLVGLSLIVGLLALCRRHRPHYLLLGRERTFPLLRLRFFPARLACIADCDGCGLFSREYASLVHIHAESELLGLERNTLLCSHPNGCLLSVAWCVIIVIFLTIGGDVVQVFVVAPIFKYEKLVGMPEIRIDLVKLTEHQDHPLHCSRALEV